MLILIPTSYSREGSFSSSNRKGMMSTTSTATTMRGQLLDAVEQVFYARGIQAASMSELRDVAGLPLRRIYQLFPSKDELIVAFLRRRHERMTAAIEARVVAAISPEDQVLAIFDHLDGWFHEPSFRGCPWTNAYSELGPTNAAVAAEVDHHELEFRALVTRVVVDAGYSPEVADVIYLLVAGSVTTAGIQHSLDAALQARHGVQMLLASAQAGAAAGV
ncbi:TetR/AcrR family transcriptional regulator [Kribbella sp. NPDC049227]|uniref:TetR/AcrR family transcriptional regulator n=1 Tax=Kribbella sp. NPDC049227 TaxID=3364113 RepID=UPI00371D586E